MNLFDQLNEGPVTEVDIPVEFDSRDIAGWALAGGAFLRLDSLRAKLSSRKST
jgi:hypothetical protein